VRLVNKQAVDANVIETRRTASTELMHESKRGFPPGSHPVLSDLRNIERQRVSTAAHADATGILVMLVVFVFLRRAATTIARSHRLHNAIDGPAR